MADDLLRSKHAFGSLEGIDAALSSGKIDAYDILFVKDANDIPYVGWIDKNGKKVIVKSEEQVVLVEGESLPETGLSGKIYIFGEDGYFWDGKKFVNLCKPTDVTELENAIKVLESLVANKADIVEVDNKIEKAKEDVFAYTDAITKKVKYEITSTPEGTLVDYREKEIRIMCPEGTVFTKQDVGSTGNANMYYMGFKAYAPEGAVSFKEGDQGVVENTMFDFAGDFSGTDKFGRNYSICWFALASYDTASDTWTYFGKNSTTEKYIGWTYVVEWYNSKGVVIATDSIRINLSNEKCHSEIKPFYMNNAMAEVDDKIEAMKAYTDEQIKALISAYTIVEF